MMECNYDKFNLLMDVGNYDGAIDIININPNILDEISDISLTCIYKLLKDKVSPCEIKSLERILEKKGRSIDKL